MRNYNQCLSCTGDRAIRCAVVMIDTAAELAELPEGNGDRFPNIMGSTPERVQVATDSMARLHNLGCTASLAALRENFRIMQGVEL